MLVSPTGGNISTGYPAMYPMPVYGTGNGGGMGFGGDWGSLITLFLLFGLFGGGFGGGMGGFGGGYDFPWLLNGQQGINNNVSSGFRDAQITDNITSVRDGVSNLGTQLCGCCSDVQMSLANGFSGVNNNLCNGFNSVNNSISNAQNALAQQMYTNQIADMQQNFALQSAFSDCCCKNQLATESLRATVLSENCADRFEAQNNTRDIITAITSGIQSVKDELCADRLEGYKREADNLRQQLNMANLAASQIAQTAQIVDQTYNRLSTCPVGTVPVYGETPIFRCNSGCGCGGNTGGFNGNF